MSNCYFNSSISIYSLSHLIFTSLLHFQFLFPATFSELPFLFELLLPEPCNSTKRFFIFSLFISPFFVRNTPSSPYLLHAPFPPHSIHPFPSFSLFLFSYNLLASSSEACWAARTHIYTWIW